MANRECVGRRNTVKRPRLTAMGDIPGTDWYGVPTNGRDRIPDLKAYARKLDRVATWCRKEAAWARSR